MRLRRWSRGVSSRPLAVYSGERGLTFLEILISLVIFSLAMIGVVGLFLTVVSAGAIGEGAAMAFSLARACSEHLQSQGYLYVASFINTSDPCAGLPGLANPVRVPTLGRTFQLAAVRTVNGNSIDLIVQASWTQRRVHTRTVATRLTLEGP